MLLGSVPGGVPSWLGLVTARAASPAYACHLAAAWWHSVSLLKKCHSGHGHSTWGPGSSARKVLTAPMSVFMSLVSPCIRSLGVHMAKGHCKAAISASVRARTSLRRSSVLCTQTTYQHVASRNGVAGERTITHWLKYTVQTLLETPGISVGTDAWAAVYFHKDL